MDHELMIKKLKKAGVAFGSGLSGEEAAQIEAFFGFRFPREIREFLSCGVPVSGEFFDWRDLSDTNLERFRGFQKGIEEAFAFDADRNEGELHAFLGDLLTDIADKDALKTAVVDWLHRSVKLIPFYAHRCFFDGMDGMPIVSFWQAVDTIFYGSDLENYLENEFLRSPWESELGAISDRMKETGIWYHLVG